MAIKNKQYASWSGLSVEAVRQHFPESDETHKGHGRKTPSGLRSTKPKEQHETLDNDDAFQFNTPDDVPTAYQKGENNILQDTGHGGQSDTEDLDRSTRKVSKEVNERKSIYDGPHGK